ncbi:MAG TPA: hypothetical protein VIF40_12110 [Methylosinus sp.]|jgi:hypothetical protein|uniref:hypothetical protein n=1 Tax=Methylosinus sp. TaxID=427 RepID=UPI002F93C38E
MLGLAAKAVVALVFVTTPALAAGQIWSVIEESSSGVMTVQGTWTMTGDGDKITGKADMQFDDGKPFAYSLEGSKKGDIYTVTLNGRSDDKSGCVWTGHIPAGADAGSAKLIGKAQCPSGSGFVIKASRM